MSSDDLDCPEDALPDHEHASDSPYETPYLVEVGDVVALTNGSAFNDTADRKAFYW